MATTAKPQPTYQAQERTADEKRPVASDQKDKAEFAKRAAPTVNHHNKAADKHDGIIHDPVKWQGQVVDYIKDVGKGDHNHNNAVQQVLIGLKDGSEKIVPKTEILRETTDAHRTFAPDRLGGPEKVNPV